MAKASKKATGKPGKASARASKNDAPEQAANGFHLPPDGQRILSDAVPHDSVEQSAGKPSAKDATPARINVVSLSSANIGTRFQAIGAVPTVAPARLTAAIAAINPAAMQPVAQMPEDVRASLQNLSTNTKRFHGAKINLLWFPGPWLRSSCADKFGYLTSATVRSSSKLDVNIANAALLNQLGASMAASGRETGVTDSSIPAGYTYFGQFVDHDFTLDVSSTIETAQDATAIHNMRSPSLDLDNVYGKGPALDPYLYVFPTTGPSTAIKMKLGTNLASGIGGPRGTAPAMKAQTDWDVPRVAGTQTAIIGDPRNDENLIVVQFQMAMLRFHNAVVDLLVAAAFTGDIFVEAKRIVTQHYQWAVVNDYLKRICGPTMVANALATVAAAVGSGFSMPVEFSVAAYRFGHSQIRDSYWLNGIFTNEPLSNVFAFNRPPNLPVRSNWVVDMNAFFDTGISVAVHNKARKIDSVLAFGLNALPGGSGIMAQLATRNLRRAMALGLPSGQATATALGVVPMTEAQLKSGLPASEVAILDASGGLLKTKTPLWYYILREAAVIESGQRLGPVGAKIVAETFVKMLKRDGDSYLNRAGGFTPFLPSATSGDFTVADLVTFAGVTQPG